MAIDFKGNDISIEDPDGNGLIYATLSLDKLRSFREKFPAYRDADNFKITLND
jgi:predicted amidohydrolase